MDEAKFQILIRALQLSESATQTNEKSPSSKRIYPIDIDGIKQELVITSSFYEHGLEAADYLASLRTVPVNGEKMKAVAGAYVVVDNRNNTWLIASSHKRFATELQRDMPPALYRLKTPIGVEKEENPKEFWRQLFGENADISFRKWAMTHLEKIGWEGVPLDYHLSAEMKQEEG